MQSDNQFIYVGVVVLMLVILISRVINWRRWLPRRAIAEKGNGAGRLAGIAGGILVLVTMWSAWRYVTAPDSLAEISAGVWWLGGTVFWGGLAVLAGSLDRRDDLGKR